MRSLICLLLVASALAGCASTGRRDGSSTDPAFQTKAEMVTRKQVVATQSPQPESEAVNPDFPGGQRLAIEAIQELDADRDVPKDATLVTALFPAGAKATILAGLRHDSATYWSTGQYVADKGVTLRFGVRVYIGGGK